MLKNGSFIQISSELVGGTLHVEQLTVSSKRADIRDDVATR